MTLSPLTRPATIVPRSSFPNSTSSPTATSIDPSECQICLLPFAAIPCNGPLNRECVFCNSVSSRADSARRHEKTCGANNPGHPYYRVYKRGRKTTACDACARIKVSCNAKNPCQRCSARSLECTYGRVCTVLAHRETKRTLAAKARGQALVQAYVEREAEAQLQRQNRSQPWLQQQVDVTAWRRPKTRAELEKLRMESPYRFLLNCTDPRVNFVNDAMVRGEPEREPQTQAQSQQPAPPPPPVVQTPVFTPELDTINPQLLFRGFMDPYLGLSLDDGSMDGSMVNVGLGFGDSMDFNTAPAPRSWSGNGATAQKSIKPRIILLEAELLQMVARYDPDTAKTHYETVKAFFRLAEFHRLLAIFFRRQQLLAKMIHWPTFDARVVDLGLLLAIALCGVAYSQSSPIAKDPPSHPNSLVQMGMQVHLHAPVPPGTFPAGNPAELVAAPAKMQPLAEEYIFRRLKEVCEDQEDGVFPRAADHILPLETCQAAYLIVLLQISVNDKNNATRRRAMTKRQPALVDAIRRLGMMSKITHPRSQTPMPTPQPSGWQQDPPWKRFVYNESCTRLALWAMFTDGLLALFCNRPPTMSMAEMVGDLPCSDELWEAPTADTYGEICNRPLMAQAQMGQLGQQQPPPQKPCVNLKSVMAGLMSDNDNMYTAVCADLTVFHLYAVAGALQFAVFSCRAQSMLDSMGPKLIKALDRWERLWDAALANVPADEQRWLGVAKHSPEFARIARRIVHASMVVSSTAEASSMPPFPSSEIMDSLRRSKYMQCRPEFDLGVFHQFILEFGGDDWPTIRGVLVCAVVQY